MSDAPHQLWFRPTPRHAWRPVGPAGDYGACVGVLVGEVGGPRRGGEWYIRPAGRPPDGKVAGPDAEPAGLFETGES